MNWTQVQITIRSEDTDRAADIVQMVAPHGMSIEDYRDLERDALTIAHIDLIDEALMEKSKQESVIRIYLDGQENPSDTMLYLQERFGACGILAKMDCSEVDDQDWADHWKRYFKPIPIGERLMICPSWESVEPDGRTVLNIDPGAAFGTGTHATTKLCLLALDSLAAPGCTICDIGCGSGILGIAGLLLGAKSAVMVDIDPQSVKTARENAKRNGVAQRAAFDIGSLAEKVQGRFDIVCANIVADVIIELCRSVREHLAQDGVFLCSGIVDIREKEVLAALEQAGFWVQKRYEDAGWVAFVCAVG